MRPATVVRDELLQAKEQFDLVVFDRGFTIEQRQTRWQAFLMKVQPLSDELARAEKRDAQRRTRAVTQIIRTAAGL